jgi:hypothetical protein
MWNELDAFQLKARDAGGWEEDHNKAGGGQLHGVAGGEPEEQIYRAETSNDGYQIRAKEQLERGESGQNWPLIILAILLGLLAAAIVAAGAAVFMLRRRIITKLVAATLGPRTTDAIAAVVQTTTEQHKVKKEKAT